MATAHEMLFHHDELSAAWASYREGRVAHCPRHESGTLALCVEGTGAVYRLICTQCGAHSRWFESPSAGALRVYPAVGDEPVSEFPPPLESPQHAPAR